MKNVEIEKYKIPKKGELSGLKFVLTGTMDSMSRDEAKAKIRKKGGKTVESVSEETDYVVAGDKPGSKFTKAKKLGIRILTEEEIQKLID